MHSRSLMAWAAMLALATGCAPTTTAAAPNQATSTNGVVSTGSAGSAVPQSTGSAVSHTTDIGSLASAQQLLAGGGGGGSLPSWMNTSGSAIASLGPATMGLVPSQYHVYEIEGINPGDGSITNAGQAWQVYLSKDDGSNMIVRYAPGMAPQQFAASTPAQQYRSGYDIDFSRWRIDSAQAVYMAMQQGLVTPDHIELISPARLQAVAGIGNAQDPVWAVSHAYANVYIDALTGQYLH